MPAFSPGRAAGKSAHIDGFGRDVHGWVRMTPSLTQIASRIRLKQLRLLIALEAHGSLHKAAEHVGLSQPGATKALHEIESVLCAPLFERTSKGMAVNDLGRCVIRYAKLIHSDLAHMRDEIVGILQGQGGRLSIGSVMGAVPLLTRAVNSLRVKQPDISVEIFEDTSARLLAMLGEGRLHLTIGRHGVAARPDAFECHCLDVPERVMLVANPNHPLATAARLGLRELSPYRWILFPADMPLRLLLEREFEEARLDFPSQITETASTYTTLMILREDPSAVALMPEDVFDSLSGFGLVAALPVKFHTNFLHEPYGLVGRKGTVLPRPAQMLLEELQREMGERNRCRNAETMPNTAD